MPPTQSASRSSFNELAARLTGQIVLPQDAAYEAVRGLWNGGVRTRPAAIVCCATAQDVVHTVRWARSHGLPLAVRGGGHDYAGRALCADGVVIDCSPLRAVTIDPAARFASVQGGATRATSSAPRGTTDWPPPPGPSLPSGWPASRWVGGMVH